MEYIIKKLEIGNSQEKIKILEELTDTENEEILQKMISRLDDDDIQVRGEAFSSLVLNENKISNLLIDNLKSKNKNIRGYTSLILANRNDSDAINAIMKLARDKRSMVRSCALGALGHLRAQDAKDVIYDCLTDTNIEVRKSALQAVIDLGFSIPGKKIKKILENKDIELEKMVNQIEWTGRDLNP